MFSAKLLIIDEHRLVSSGIQALLLMNGFKFISVVNTINDGIGAIINNHFDIVIFDPDFKDIKGIAFLRDVIKSKQYVKTIVFSENTNDSLVMQSVIQGANGFVSKYDSIQILTSAIGCVYNSVNYLPKELVERTSEYLDEQNMIARLTPRESTILHHLTLGKSNKNIAIELGLNNKTISTYKAKIFEKLQTTNLIDIIEIAKRNGYCQ